MAQCFHPLTGYSFFVLIACIEGAYTERAIKRLTYTFCAFEFEVEDEVEGYSSPLNSPEKFAS